MSLCGGENTHGTQYKGLFKNIVSGQWDSVAPPAAQRLKLAEQQLRGPVSVCYFCKVKGKFRIIGGCEENAACPYIPGNA